MSKESLNQRLLNILYKAQLSNIHSPKELDDFEKEVGDVIMHQLITTLNKQKLTNLTSQLGKHNNCQYEIKEPLLTEKGIKYVKDLKKPWWKKNILNIIGIFTVITLGVIDRLPKIDAIIDTIEKYILKSK